MAFIASPQKVLGKVPERDNRKEKIRPGDLANPEKPGRPKKWKKFRKT